MFFQLQSYECTEPRILYSLRSTDDGVEADVQSPYLKYYIYYNILQIDIHISKTLNKVEKRGLTRHPVDGNTGNLA